MIPEIIAPVAPNIKILYGSESFVQKLLKLKIKLNNFFTGSHKNIFQIKKFNINIIDTRIEKNF